MKFGIFIIFDLSRLALYRFRVRCGLSPEIIEGLGPDDIAGVQVTHLVECGVRLLNHLRVGDAPFNLELSNKVASAGANLARKTGFADNANGLHRKGQVMSLHGGIPVVGEGVQSRTGAGL